MRELDALLNRWLERRWVSADSELRAAFRMLLESEDDQLWDWLLGRTRPEASALRAIVDDVRRTAAGSA